LRKGPTEVGSKLLPGGGRAGQKMPPTVPTGSKAVIGERGRIDGIATFVV
jgi:hypothetical protein